VSAPPSPFPSIVRATGVQVAGHLASAIATLASLGIAARALGTEGFGRYTFFLAAFAVLAALVDFGTMGAAIRRAAALPAHAAQAVGAAVRFRLLLAGAGVLAAGLLARASGEPRPAAVALAATPLLGHALAPLSIPLHVGLRFGPVAASRALGSLSGLLFAGALAASGVRDPALFLLAAGTGSVVSNASAAVAARRGAERPDRPAPAGAPGGFLRESAALGAGTLLRQVVANLDSFFLRASAGPSALARFNAPYRLLLASCAVPGYACAAALPALARAVPSDRRALEARLARGLLALAAAGGTVAAVLAVPILRLLYGEVGGAAAPAMRLLVPAGLLAFPGNLFVVGLVARNRSTALLKISAAGLVLRAALDAWLVPALADRGAAIAAAATEGFVLAACAAARGRGTR
jgi:O-antigen/teichoic acid export membrane protein